MGNISKVYSSEDTCQLYNEYVEFLKKYDINVKAPHWNADGKILWRDAKRQLIQLFRRNLCLGTGDELHRVCSVRYCCNPLHYTVVHKEDLTKLDEIDLLEIEELTDMVDIKILKKMGFANYFRYFNAGNPLPAKVYDLYTACNLVLSRERKRLLPASVLINRRKESLCTSLKRPIPITLKRGGKPMAGEK
jgi:hypothetical protein